MKTTKNGKIKISKEDLVIGNYVINSRNGYVNICSKNNLISWRVSTLIPYGFAIHNAIENFLGLKKVTSEQIKANAKAYLENCAAMGFSMLNVVPDVDYLQGCSKLVNDAVQKNKALYGVVENETEEEALDKVKKSEELKDNLQKDLEKIK